MNANTLPSSASTSTSITKNSLLEKCQEDIIKHFKGNSSFSFRFVYSKSKSKLMIYTKLTKQSITNPSQSDIHFLIILNQTYPISDPIVLCKSNFTNPSFFDNRNIASVLLEKWSHPSNSDNNRKLIAIISLLPSFVAKVDRDTKNSLLCYDEVPYTQMNKNATFVYMQSYLLITDLYVIILFPDKHIRNRAKIIFQGELLMIVDILPHPVLVFDKETKESTETVAVESSNGKEEATMDIKWNDAYQKKLNKTLKVKHKEYVMIFNIINNKRQHLVKTFDLTFPNPNNTIEDIMSIIDIREKEMTNAESQFYAVSDLLELYQRIIEIFSMDEKEKCAKYVEKLQALIKEINKDINNPQVKEEGK